MRIPISGIPPELASIEANNILKGELREIEIASSGEIARIVADEEPLDYGQVKTAQKILVNTNLLESINVDEEAMQFYISYSVEELWKAAFRDKDNTLGALEKNGNKYHDLVVDTFLSDFEVRKTSVIKDQQGIPFQIPQHLCNCM